MGADEGRKAWDDAMLFDDPDAPTTITQPFDYGIFTGGPVTGSVAIDAGSIISLDPRQPSPKQRCGATRAIGRDEHQRHVSGGRPGAEEGSVELPRRRPVAQRGPTIRSR